MSESQQSVAPQPSLTNIICVAEDMARNGAAQVNAYFKDATPDQEKKAKFALTALRGYASLRSTRAREASTALAIAKFAKMQGEALKPVFESLTGHPALLEKAVENSNALGVAA